MARWYRGTHAHRQRRVGLAEEQVALQDGVPEGTAGGELHGAEGGEPIQDGLGLVGDGVADRVHPLALIYISHERRSTGHP